MKKNPFVENQKGFTLVELMFVGFLLPLVGMAIFLLLDSSLDIFHYNNVYSKLNEGAMQTFRSLSRELGQTSSLSSPSHITISNTGVSGTSIVTFQIPVDWDSDGDVITASANPSVEWGAYTEVGQTTSGNLNYAIRYRIIANAQGINELWREVMNAFSGGQVVSSKVLVSDIQTFTVSKNSNQATITLTLQATEPISTRVFSASFNHNVMLRNDVS